METIEKRIILKGETELLLVGVQLISKLSSTSQKSRSRFITDFSTCKDAFLKFERHIFYTGKVSLTT
jgi:hypothetical protein